MIYIDYKTQLSGLTHKHHPTKHDVEQEDGIRSNYFLIFFNQGTHKHHRSPCTPQEGQCHYDTLEDAVVPGIAQHTCNH